MANTNWKKYLDKGIAAVKAGGLVLGDTSLHRMEIKADGSPVTAADKAVEKQIRDTLIPLFPECGFEGEEFETVRPDAPLRWLCDPIDGTWSFLNKEITAVISLSLFEGGIPKVAIIYNPFTQELYTGCEGQPSLLNQQVLPRMTRNSLADSLINFHVHASQTDLISQIYHWWEQERFAKVVSQGGSVAYGMAKVLREFIVFIWVKPVSDPIFGIWELGFSSSEILEEKLLIGMEMICILVRKIN